MNKYDIVRFIGESKSPIDAKTSEIAIISSVTRTNTRTLLQVDWKEGNHAKKVAEGERNYGVADETIERIIEHFSDDKRQLIGVLWYNK